MVLNNSENNSAIQAAQDNPSSEAFANNIDRAIALVNFSQGSFPELKCLDARLNAY